MANPVGSYDAVVVGAGPGGATAAAFMARAGLRVMLVDKASFPRDKICGDAISGKSVDVLRRLELIERVLAAPQVKSWGIDFGGPDGNVASIPFTKELDREVPPGFVCARETYDQILFERAVEWGAEPRLETQVKQLIQEDGIVRGVVLANSAGKNATLKNKGAREEVRAPIVIGADGAYSVVARELGLEQLDERYYSAGLRAYYRNVGGFHPRNHIELHFLPDALPGYFWIFPMANGMANVGIGMLSSSIKRKDVKLKQLLAQCIEHPSFRDRFVDAEPVGSVKGWGLPLGSKPRPMVGNGWMLVGDAASLIDPFTGEGIGNAMVSGEIAARQVADAIVARRFDEAFLAAYQRDVRSYLGNELRVSHALQRLSGIRALIGFVIRKAATTPQTAAAISCMFDDEHERRKLLRPSFYFRLLTS